MKHSRLNGLLSVLTCLAISTVGCTDWKKKYQDLEKQYAELNAKHNKLIQDTRTVRQTLSQMEGERNKYKDELDKTEGELATARAKIIKLEQGASGGPPGERTVFKKTLGSDILFSAGRATLTDAGKRELGGIIATIKSSYPGTTIRVYGYTDTDPIVRTKNLWKDNLDLSANRAMAVTRHLMLKGISAERMETIGMGEANPVASNATKAGKAKNRRVEIVLVR